MKKFNKITKLLNLNNSNVEELAFLVDRKQIRIDRVTKDFAEIFTQDFGSHKISEYGQYFFLIKRVREEYEYKQWQKETKSCVKPLFNNNGITIYYIPDFPTAKKIGKETPWCITKKPQHFAHYRSYLESSIYFIVDDNRSDQLKMVAVNIFPHQQTFHDLNNTAEGMSQDEINKYLRYLEKNAIPTDIFKYVPLSEEEKSDRNLVKQPFHTLTKVKKMKFIAYGGVLSYDTFDDEQDEDVRMSYVTTGRILTDLSYLFSPNETKEYLKSREIVSEFTREQMSMYEYLRYPEDIRDTLLKEYQHILDDDIIFDEFNLGEYLEAYDCISSDFADELSERFEIDLITVYKVAKETLKITPYNYAHKYRVQFLYNFSYVLNNIERKKKKNKEIGRVNFSMFHPAYTPIAQRINNYLRGREKDVNQIRKFVQTFLNDLQDFRTYVNTGGVAYQHRFFKTCSHLSYKHMKDINDNRLHGLDYLMSLLPSN